MLNRFAILLSLIAIINQPTVVYALELQITDNGSGSTSQVEVVNTTDTNIVQTNNAEIHNDIVTNADTGNNNANQNSGNSSIETGNINTSVTVTNVANTSINQTDHCCDQTTQTQKISNNGDGSKNTINNTNSNTNNFTLINNANITNSVKGTANTGQNNANKNVGNVYINTGNIIASQLIQNGPINSTIVRASYPSDPNLSLAISSNGSGSINKITQNTSDNNTVSLANNANIINNSNWWLNTGLNSANRNVGNVGIETGNIFAQLVIKNVNINSNILHLDLACCPETPDNPYDPGDHEDHGNNPGSSTSNSSSSSSSASAGPAVLGLSFTSSK